MTKEREEIEKIITEKIKEALGSGGLISESMKMDERFTYLGKEVYIIKSDINKLREDLDKLLERNIMLYLALAFLKLVRCFATVFHMWIRIAIAFI